MSCTILTRESLDALLAGRLRGTQLAAVRDHLAEPCEACLNLLEGEKWSPLFEEACGGDAKLSWVEAGAMLNTALAAAAESTRPIELGTKQAEQTPRTVFEDAPWIVVGGARGEALRSMLERIACSQINVLLMGETGVGKGVLAAELHRRSPRSAGPFVTVNCAELPESLLEATELFGYEQGRFTGGVDAKPGLIESADGGTLFLEEVSEVPQSVQSWLLRVLEDRQVRRLGSAKPRCVDIRIVAATSWDLKAAVKAGRFRPDLYFRLNGITLTVPPLRERPGDLEALAHHILEQAARQTGRPTPKLTPDAIEALRWWSWPGNIRELQTALERAAALCADGVITPEHLPARKLRSTLYAEVQAPREVRERIGDVLHRCGGNQTRAAQELGISRRTLANWLARHGPPVHEDSEQSEESLAPEADAEVSGSKLSR